MALLSLVEAAMRLGFSVELVEKLTTKCPKYNEDRTLQAKKVDEELMFDQSELDSYRSYLREPWPMSEKASRPSVPSYIAEDVKAESHYKCAICGDANGGEVAHIDPVRETLDNSPDNLLLLCPNHHTIYDYGFKPNTNVTRDVILATKTVKRASRRRMLQHEANSAKTFRRVIKLLKNFEEQAKNTDDADLASVYATETRNLFDSIPDLCSAAQDAASRDEGVTDLEKALAARAPALSKAAALGAQADSTGKTQAVRTAAQSIIEISAKVFVDLDEVDCPHCDGAGQTGLVGDLCAYCRGSCFVSTAEFEEYDREDIDEENCPHCNGTGQTGLTGDLCSYCKGSQMVSAKQAEAYDRDTIDEVDCPRCHGKGTTGLVGDICGYCKGSCVVSAAKHEAYDPEEIDEVDCPRCHGKGTTGLVGDICGYCKGSCLVAQETADDYDPDNIDEVACPHCEGRGLVGLGHDYCAYCKGSCFISRASFEEYDPDDIDEVDCPRCDGSGQTGLVGDTCKLCKGRQVVTAALAEGYVERYG